MEDVDYDNDNEDPVGVEGIETVNNRNQKIY